MNKKAGIAIALMWLYAMLFAPDQVVIALIVTVAVGVSGEIFRKG